MTLSNNPERLNRFIHEAFHEVARDEEMKDVWRDMVSIVIGKWENFKDKDLKLESKWISIKPKRELPEKLHYFGMMWEKTFGDKINEILDYLKDKEAL